MSDNPITEKSPLNRRTTGPYGAVRPYIRRINVPMVGRGGGSVSPQQVISELKCVLHTVEERKLTESVLQFHIEQYHLILIQNSQLFTIREVDSLNSLLIAYVYVLSLSLYVDLLKVGK